MKSFKITISVLLIVAGFSCTTVFSQQLPLYSQYVQNSFLLNPAIAGVDGYTTVNLTARRQWLGYKDGPQTYSASAQSRLLKKRRNVSGGKLSGGRSGNVGIGGNFFGDRNGAMSKVGASFAYAYHIHFQNSQLSFGLGLSLTQVGIDKEKLVFEQGSDPLVIKNMLYPDASLGVFWSSINGFIGLSVDQLTQAKIKLTEGVENYAMLRQYYVLGGYNFPVGDIYDIEPSFLVKTNENFSFQADLGGRFFISKMYWGGLYYRSTSKSAGTLIISMGLKYNQFVFGYAFDYANTGMTNATYGSHEFVMAAKFGDSARRFRWLDRY